MRFMMRHGLSTCSQLLPSTTTGVQWQISCASPAAHSQPIHPAVGGQPSGQPPPVSVSDDSSDDGSPAGRCQRQQTQARRRRRSESRETRDGWRSWSPMLGSRGPRATGGGGAGSRIPGGRRGDVTPGGRESACGVVAGFARLVKQWNLQQICLVRQHHHHTHHRHRHHHHHHSHRTAITQSLAAHLYFSPDYYLLPFCV